MGLDELCRVLGVIPQSVLATLLGLEESTLGQWHKTGKGPKRFRVGRQHFYRLDDVKTYIDCPDAATACPSLTAARVAGELS